MIVDNNFNKWNINKLPRIKNTQGLSNVSGVVTLNTSNNAGTGYSELEGHYLWGQFFNGKQDVNGDFTTNGDVNFYGNLNFMGAYDPDDDLNGNLNIGNVNADNGHFKEMNADLLKSAKVYIDNLTVTGSAHFFELIIDKIRSVGGAIMLTPGDGFELWGYNSSNPKTINLWWVKTDDKNGKYNKWEVGDQALCRSFDSAQIGTSSNIDNKYWWAKVVGVEKVGKWCVKLGLNKYNPDEVMALPIDDNNAYYTNTHSYLKKSDFIESTDYVYVEKAKRTHWITNEEYFALDDSVKPEYEYSQLYVHQNEDGSVLKITQLQYENNNYNDKVLDILVYDEKEDDWRVLRNFCKADCKFCYNITISIDTGNYATGSTFRVTEGSPAHYVYVFQEGDNIVMLGNQNDPNRQNAIYLNSGGNDDSLDNDLRPPFFAQYKGINDFELKSHRLTWFSGGSNTQGVYDNEIRGNLKVSSGKTVQDYVDNEINSQLIVAEDHITAEVTKNVGNELKRTGIDIEDGKITLDAEKTLVTGELTFNNQKSGGIVLYDSNGNAVVHINNEQIETPGDTTVLQYTYGNSSSTGSWNIISEKVKIGQRKNGDTVSITNINLNISAYDGSAIYPSANACSLTVKIYNSNNTVVYNKTVTMSKSENGSYNYNGTLNSNITAQSVYTVEFTTSFNETFTNNVKSNASFTYNISYGEQIITRIGSNGMFASQAASQYFLSNSNEQTLRMPTSGLRVVNKSNYAGVQVLNENGWYNIHNSKTTLVLGVNNFSSATVPYGGANHSVSKAYTINPDDGIYEYIIDTTIGTDDFYMVLPPISSTPVGWRCKITVIKFGDNNSTVKIVPSIEQNIAGTNVIIQDSHLNGTGNNNDNQGVRFNAEYEAEFTCLGMSYNVSGRFIGWRTNCDMLSL